MSRLALSSFLSLCCTSLAACSGGAPAPTTEHPSPPPPPADAAADAAAPDAGAPEAVLVAPAWVFRYHTADRTETWTLRYAGDGAQLVVETAQGTQRYLGTAHDGATLALAVSTGTAKLALECKHATRPLSAKCNDAKARPIDVLDCYHPDFQAPMPFGRAPGIEYVVDATCNGYRLLAP